MNQFPPEYQTKQTRRRRTYFLLLLTIFALPLLTFVTVKGGYCSGWWGRDSLFLRALWLCSCSEAFEQSLYPDHVEVMYSACNNVHVEPLPDKRYMRVFGDDQFEASERYILDGITQARTPLAFPSNLYIWEFLSQELILIRLREADGTVTPHILNWKNNEMVQIQLLGAAQLPSPYLTNREPNPELIALFRHVDIVFVLPGGGRVVGLKSNWWEDLEHNFILYEGQIPGREPGWLQEIVVASGVPYSEVPLSTENSDSIIASDGSLMADYTGVYEVDSGKQIVSSFQLPGVYGGYYPCCWLPQENAVVYTFQDRSYSSFPHNNRYNLGSPERDSDGFWMPVLKIKLP